MGKETKVSCPKCGTKFQIANKDLVGQKTPSKQLGTAKERIEALRNVGIDVSNLFAIIGVDGDEHIVSKKDGMVSILDDNDSIFSYIIQHGTVPNRRLFRRWILAQMFHMMSYTESYSREPVGITDMIHRLGYEYQWKMLMNELYAQMTMENRDKENFTDRNRWFNASVVAGMMEDYIKKLKKRVESLKEKRCKGIPYKRICGRNIFVSDLHVKLYNPLSLILAQVKQANNATKLYNVALRFNEMRIKMAHDTPQSKIWIEAYKGAGAFFSMQNLIRFHNCIAIDDTGKRLNKSQSLAFILAKAEAYKNFEGWRLFALMKKMLEDNNIDIQKKMAGWRK